MALARFAALGVGLVLLTVVGGCARPASATPGVFDGSTACHIVAGLVGGVHAVAGLLPPDARPRSVTALDAAGTVLGRRAVGR